VYPSEQGASRYPHDNPTGAHRYQSGQAISLAFKQESPLACWLSKLRTKAEIRFEDEPWTRIWRRKPRRVVVSGARGGPNAARSLAR
jgi:hypothetical protein